MRPPARTRFGPGILRICVVRFEAVSIICTCSRMYGVGRSSDGRFTKMNQRNWPPFCLQENLCLLEARPRRPRASFGQSWSHERLHHAGHAPETRRGCLLQQAPRQRRQSLLEALFPELSSTGRNTLQRLSPRSSTHRSGPRPSSLGTTPRIATVPYASSLQTSAMRDATRISWPNATACINSLVRRPHNAGQARLETGHQ